MDGYSYEEIADVTQLPLGTVKTGIFRARQQLRQELASYEGTTNE
jgi:DNA-directed RNA polymerase specialized sigma24 family protein